MLYKYYQSSDDKRKTRKINSDRKAAELIEVHLEREKREQEEKRKLYRQHHPEEFPEEEEEESAPMDGEEAEGEEASSAFTPGLPVEMIDPDDYVPKEPEPDPENSKAAEEARVLAEQIVAEAQTQAAAILQEAEAEAGGIRQQAMESGYSEGTARAEEEKNAFLAEQEAALNAKIEELEREKEAAVSTLEPEMLDVMLTVFNKVFHIQFDDKKEILSYLVMNTIMGVEGSKEFRIKTSNDNFPYLSAHLEEIREQVGEEYHLEVVADGTLGENKCIIETDAGFFDCSLGVHLESLIKDLKSICLSST